MLHDDQHERLTTLLENLETVAEGLPARPRDFIYETVERHSTYGKRLLLSARQWDWLEDLHREHCSHAPELPKLDGSDRDDIPF